MFSITKQFTPTLTSFPSKSHRHHTSFRSFSLAPIKASTAGGNGVNDEGSDPSPPAPPSSTVGIRFKRGSRKRRQQRQKEEEEGRQGMKAKPPPKEWEAMSLNEKAVELYVGEKGLLFWLNKFAYASIFIVIGGWILFRFVGPSLNLYQLDTPPLSPESMFKGSE
nr:endoglucanase 2-like isoform X2 [Ipomoea batatas]